MYRSLDGGATWQRVLYKDANTGASDLAIDPKNPSVLYAALWESRLGPTEDGNEFEGTGGGLYKSTDGGTTWHQLTTGLPNNAVQFDVAIAPSQPTRLYVALSTTTPAAPGTPAAPAEDAGKGPGIYRSDDAGATWTKITTDTRPAGKIGGGDLPVPVVDPKNPDVVYVASTVAMKSSDGGKTWTWLRGAPGGDDYQNLWINPSDPNTFVLVSDQGQAENDKQPQGSAAAKGGDIAAHGSSRIAADAPAKHGQLDLRPGQSPRRAERGELCELRRRRVRQPVAPLVVRPRGRRQELP